MSALGIVVEPLSRQDTDWVAHLHLNCLQTPFRGRAGAWLLKCYYQALIDSRGAQGYAAHIGGKAVGFVCGIWDSTAIRKTLLSSSLTRLLCWSLVQVVTYPRLLPLLVGRLLHISTSSTARPTEGYELRPIVVKAEYRGMNVAQHLVQQLLQDAATHGFTTLFLYTESGNTAAKRFYTKVGFDRCGIYRSRTTDYIRYEIATDKTIL